MHPGCTQKWYWFLYFIFNRINVMFPEWVVVEETSAKTNSELRAAAFTAATPTQTHRRLRLGHQLKFSQFKILPLGILCVQGITDAGNPLVSSWETLGEAFWRWAVCYGGNTDRRSHTDLWCRRGFGPWPRCRPVLWLWQYRKRPERPQPSLCPQQLFSDLYPAALEANWTPHLEIKTAGGDLVWNLLSNFQ